MIGQQTRARVENPARWLKAAERAVSEGIQVRQLQGTGQWIANSGSDSAVAYELEVTGNVAHGCDCLAGLNGDPCCKHRASFYLLIGALDLTPEPEPPAPALADCWACSGCGECWYRGGYSLPCEVCKGSGAAPLVAQANALVAAAEPEFCGECGSSLDEDAERGDALTLCGACVDRQRREAWMTRLSAIGANHADALRAAAEPLAA